MLSKPCIDKMARRPRECPRRGPGPMGASQVHLPGPGQNLKKNSIYWPSFPCVFCSGLGLLFLGPRGSLLSSMADWHDYNEDYSDGFASQPDETQDDMLASEFAGVDAISRGIFKHDNKESSAWRDLDKLQDVHFNFATFFEGLQRCYRDLLLGHVHVRSHFGRFVQYFEDIMEAGSVPEPGVPRRPKGAYLHFLAEWRLKRQVHAPSSLSELLKTRGSVVPSHA